MGSSALLVIVTGLALLFGTGGRTGTLHAAPAAALLKKTKLNPYQVNLKACLDPEIDVSSIDSHKKLYEKIETFYSLMSSQTLFREVLYKQRNELKKLRFEDATIQIFSVDDEDNLTLLSTEKTGPGARAETDVLRHRPLSADARIQQFLIRADIRSDFLKVKESRTGGLTVQISWSDGQIKTLNLEWIRTKKSLSCAQKDGADICTCSG